MNTTRRSLLAWPVGLLALPGHLVASTTGAAPPWPELAGALPTPIWAGAARLRVWGFEVYDAQLWVAAGFEAQRYAQHPLALSLTYLRTLRGKAIAERSMAEMLRQGPIDTVLQTAWLARMQQLFPDVAEGDRLTGVHQPGRGARFWLNGRALGAIDDAAFSAQFFGIWLHTATSEPAMRRDLLAALGGA